MSTCHRSCRGALHSRGAQALRLAGGVAATAGGVAVVVVALAVVARYPAFWHYRGAVSR